MRRFALILALFFPTIFACAQLPKPLTDHPGNIFLAGQDVTVALPSGSSGHWQAIDYDGRVVAHGIVSGGRVNLGRLPVGFFNIQNDGSSAQTTAGVISGLRAPTPPASPIGLDTAASTFYKTPEQWRAIANLAAIAGVNWVRDRYSWGEIEPQRGNFVEHVKYDDSTTILHQAGLKVLDVSGSAPSWANAPRNTLPVDLRDAYDFYRAIAHRWRDQVAAFEPWNEADFHNAGNEIASYQKAAYLGLKAGNPKVIVSLSPWGVPTRSTLQDFQNNDVSRYFDTYNLHIYAPLERYDELYGEQRNVSGGKPLWVTEFNLAVKWEGDPVQQEPSPAVLRIQAERVAKVYASTLYQGTQEAMYFILGNYSEGHTQFGLLHDDLTPRPAYLALAAVGRLLAGARPIGQVKGATMLLSGLGTDYVYAFRAAPDGQPRDVIVAWDDGGQSDLYLPVGSLAVYDHLGRQLSASRPPGTFTLSSAPIFILLPLGADNIWVSRVPPATGVLSRLVLHTPTLVRPPAAPALSKEIGHPSPVVLQGVFPESQLIKGLHGDLSSQPANTSVARIRLQPHQQLQIFAYNFSDKPHRITLHVNVPGGWNYTLPEKVVELPAQGRVPIPFDVTPAFSAQGNPSTVRIQGTMPGISPAILSFTLLP